MSRAEELILEDVRCFQGEQRGRLRPITLLVGENSTGKSTFLGCFGVMHQMLSRSNLRFDAPPDFNEEPFSMGSFRNIVRSKRGPGPSISEFKLGVKVGRPRNGGLTYEQTATFAEQGSQPVDRSHLYRFDAEAFLEVRRGDAGRAILSIPGRETETNLPFILCSRRLDWLVADRDVAPNHPEAQPIIDYLRKLLPPGARKGGARLRGQFQFDYPILEKLVSVAPLRAKPKRTYDPVRETASPEGEDIPMLMMRLNHLKKSSWQSLHKGLVKFGKQSGLFSDIKVRRHGNQISDPFQLQIKVHSGSHANLVDVGYGVSQSLPILVNLFSGDHFGPRTFLLQQPEVHLHPRGQAELANLFAKAAVTLDNRFLIETHSDYIIDRIRICVREGILPPDDVSIIFFEPKNNGVTIHNIALDKYGNLENAPSGYRNFFLRETNRLLGFQD